jgi:hypothetical protein
MKEEIFWVEMGSERSLSVVFEHVLPLAHLFKQSITDEKQNQ